MVKYLFKTNNISEEVKSIESDYQKYNKNIKNLILQIYLNIWHRHDANLQDDDYKIIDTSGNDFARNRIPDNVILYKGRIDFFNDFEASKVKTDIKQKKEKIIKQEVELLQTQIGVEETDVTFIQNNESGGNTLRRLKPKNKKDDDFDYEVKISSDIIENNKEDSNYEINFKNLEDKLDYWNDLQESLLNAIEDKNSKNNGKGYKTEETYLLINISHKLLPMLIEKTKKLRALSSETEIFNFCFQFIKELEELAVKRNKSFSNLSLTMIYFCIVGNDLIYNITLPCFLTNEVVKRMLIVKEKVDFDQKNENYKYVLLSSLELINEDPNDITILSTNK